MNILNHQIGGISYGGFGTCIVFPTLGFAFDIGMCPEKAVHISTILITHHHLDHIWGVVQHCSSRRMRRMSPPTYIMSKEVENGFDDIMRVGSRFEEGLLPFNKIVLTPDDRYRLSPRYFIKPFKSYHRVPCQGYSIWTSKKVLREEYKGLCQNEIKNLAISGEVVSERLEYPAIAFTGDTRIDVVEREEVVRKAELLIIEVTFLDERVTRENAYEGYHIHIDDIVEKQYLFENKALIFTHPSMRYSKKEVTRLISEKLKNTCLKDRYFIFEQEPIVRRK